MPSVLELCDKIADNWGGSGCPRKWNEAGTQFTFYEASDGHIGFVYQVTVPGEDVAVFEDSGRPAGTVNYNDRLVVRAINDAPDAIWEVMLDGTYEYWDNRTGKASSRNLMDA